MAAQDILALIIVSFLSSTLTAIIGMGGGTLLISFMPLFLPPAALVPVHGVVQLASNASRALFGFRDIAWHVFMPFAAGALVGMAAGSRFVVRLPSRYILLALACFILLVTWLPRTWFDRPLPGKFLTLGVAQGFLTLIVGATGPLNPPFLLREGLKRDTIVVTQAVMMTALHAMKVVTFGLLGFLFNPYIVLMGGMVVAVSLGSYAGTRLRERLPEEFFRKLFKAVITLLALRMILSVLMA
ncbi:MAG: TSUP family transporter [Deltaproteobacteria bacterium]|nr:TSUP family transporter [Deltaproteobacteria bacterium]NIS77242.1 TSUP family transporter [Deltaproteobacteria bacterium]